MPVFLARINTGKKKTEHFQPSRAIYRSCTNNCHELESRKQKSELLAIFFSNVVNGQGVNTTCLGRNGATGKVFEGVQLIFGLSSIGFLMRRLSPVGIGFVFCKEKFLMVFSLQE